MEVEAAIVKRARETEDALQLDDPNEPPKKGGNSFHTAMSHLAAHTHPHMQQVKPVTTTAIALAALQREP